LTGDAAATVEKPPRKRQERSLRTQQRLLDAAVAAFSDSGFKATSTRNIAQRAGVHHPLIAYHFKSKDALWRAAADRVFGQLEARLVEARATAAGSSRKARMAALIRTYAHYAASEPALHRMLVLETGHAGPRLDWLVHKYLRPFVRTMTADLHDLQREGVAAHGHPALLVNMIRVIAAGLPALMNEVKKSSNVDLLSGSGIDAMADLIVSVFLPGDSGSDLGK
jgi:AcrR family transcriptional regulator